MWEWFEDDYNLFMRYDVFIVKQLIEILISRLLTICERQFLEH
jgi:hypothetical protein